MNACRRFNRLSPAFISGILSLLPSALSAETYLVGPNQPYNSISEVPWESLTAGAEIVIYWRPTAYREKWVIAAVGTAENPVIIRGVPGENGSLPIIDGQDATTRLQLDYWNENRSVIKIGGSSTPANVLPSHIIIESLNIRGARPPHDFTDDSGNPGSYATNAAAIHIERGTNIIIRNCVLRESGNGLFVSSSDSEASRDILIEGNWLHSNGNAGSILHHNAYTAGIGLIYQYNRFGPLQDGAGGNNLKDRSAGLIVRHNWIEGGNRQLDLVDAEDSILIQQDPSYGITEVYGNLLIEPDGAGNSQIVHYGGDSGVNDAYRKGTLRFFHNTVISTRRGNTTLFRFSTADESCVAHNNVFYATAGGDRLAILNQDGTIDLSHNWHQPGWVGSHGIQAGVINDDGSSVVDEDPGFRDPANQDFGLDSRSTAIDSAADGPPEMPTPLHQYQRHVRCAPRLPTGTEPDIGALEFRRPADFNADGSVDAADLAALLGAWGSCPTPPTACTPDLNRDGVVTADDLAALLGDWDA